VAGSASSNGRSVSDLLTNGPRTFVPYGPESVGHQFLSAEYITDSKLGSFNVKQRGLTVWTTPQAIKNKSVTAESVALAVESP
jgi:hypothetical protein